MSDVPHRDDTPPLPTEALLDALGEGVLVLDAAWRIRHVNAEAERVLGRRREELCGQRLWTEFPRILGTPFETAYRRAMAEQVSVTAEELFAPHGVRYEVRAVPCSGHLMVLFRDVTARHQAEQERARSAARLRELLMRAPAAVCLLRGPEHVFELSNPLHRQLHGGRDFLGLPIRQAQPELAGHGFYELLDRVYTTGEPHMGKEALVRVDLRGDGVVEERFFDFTYQPVRDGEGRVTGVAGFAFEVTEQVRARRELEQLAARLREGEARFRHLFDSPMMGLIFTDYTGQVLEANDTFLRMLGFSRQDMAEGRVRWEMLTPSEYREASARAMAELQSTGHARPFEKDYFRKDGSRLPVLMGSTRVEEQQLNVTFVLDLTERRWAEQRLQLLSEASTLLGGSLDYTETLESLTRLVVPQFADWCAVDMLTEDGRVERLAVAHPDPEKVALLRELIRYNPIDLSAETGAGRVLRTGQPQWVPDIPEEALVAVTRSPEALRSLRTLGLRSYLCVPLVARGRVLGCLSMAHAESGRRYTQDDLRLADDVARRAALSVDNARLYREAQEAIRMRDEFLSIASHELKTPLTSLRLQLSLIDRNMGGESRERLRPKVAGAHRQVDRLSGLVDTLLDVSRIATGRIALERVEVDLSLMAHEAAERLREVFEQAGSPVHLHAEAPVTGWWDALRLDQVLVNLLSNAAKYGQGRPISVRVEADVERARFIVQDEGIGIPPEALPRLFGRFERAVSERHYGGLGLGLYISREIVQAHGGRIEVRSRPGEGSTFVVDLPRGGPPG
jgi:PAS domain S-box-containing protein